MKLRAVNEYIVVKATTSDDFQQQTMVADVIGTVDGISDKLKDKRVLVPRGKMALEAPNSEEETQLKNGIHLAAKTKTVVIKLEDVLAIVEE